MDRQRRKGVHVSVFADISHAATVKEKREMKKEGGPLSKLEKKKRQNTKNPSAGQYSTMREAKVAPFLKK